MTHFTWLLVALPLAGAAILLFGGRRTDAWGHWLGCGTALAAFAVGVTLLAELLGRDGAGPRHPPAAVHLDPGRPAPGRLRPAARPAVDVLRAADHRRRLADPHLLGRLHGRRPGPAPVFRLPQPVPGRDAAAGARRQLPGAVRRLGRRGPGVLPADRFLVPQAVGGHGGQEGVRGQPGRRRRPGPGHVPDVQHLRHAVVCRSVRRRARPPARAR